MFRSNYIKINQNNKIIEQNNSIQSELRRSNGNDVIQNKIMREKNERLSDINDQLTESNKPTVTIKLEEYELLKNKADKYQRLIDSITGLQVLENSHKLVRTFYIRIKNKEVTRLLVEALRKTSLGTLAKNEREFEEAEVVLVREVCNDRS